MRYRKETKIVKL